MTLKKKQAEMRARMKALKLPRGKSRTGTQPERATKQASTKPDPRKALVEGPATKRCETCGRETPNPRFCSRSCAAVTNNVSFPKRKPEGECERCWTAIPRHKRYCEACQTIVKAEKVGQQRHLEENYQSWLTPNGERREGPVIRMSVRKAFKSEPCSPGKKLTCGNTAGELIDQLIGICVAQPPYLRKADAMRYVSLLNELKVFECIVLSPQGKSKTPVNNISIRRLPFALEQWVNSYSGKAHHPMMPAYAMDTGRLIEFHVVGSYQSDWELEEIVEAGKNVWHLGTFESPFRKHFTTRFGGLRVLCQVPETEHSIDQQEWIRTLQPKDKFLVRIERCHLSAGWGGSGFDVICNDSDLDCDLMSEFCVTGELFVRHNAHAKSNTFAPNAFTVDSSESHATHKFSVCVPAHWITHALIRPDREDVLLPVPRWQPEDVDPVSTRVPGP
jgi:hypothetical protein